MDIRDAANGDRIAQILNLAFRIGERRPRRKTRPVWIAGSRKVDPVAGHLLSQLPISRSPVPGRLVQVVEDIPELGEVARAPTRVDGAGRERRLLSKRVVKDGALPRSGLQPRP